MNISNESSEPSLASIFALVKDMSDKNKKTTDMVVNLTNRIDSLEANPSLFKGTSLPKRKLHSLKSITVPAKKQRIADHNNNDSNSSIVENQSFNIQGSKQSVPSIRGPVAKSLSSSTTSAKQQDPFIREPLAMPGRSIETSNLPSNSALVIDSTITNDYTDLELEGDNIELEELERMFLTNDEETEPATSSKESDTEVNPHDDNDLPIICNKAGGNWEISEDTMKWYQTVADLELDNDQMASLEDMYVPPDNLVADFVPPPIPNVFWNKMRNNSTELYKQKAILKSQKMNTLAIKPLLSVLDQMDRNDPKVNMIASSVQLMCSANLQLSRLRRASTSRLMKNELKNNLFSCPVTHLNLFGSDFESAADQAIKSQSSSHKVLFHPKPQPQLKQTDPTVPVSRPAVSGPSTSTAGYSRERNQPFRQHRGNRGRGRYSFPKRR